MQPDYYLYKAIAGLSDTFQQRFDKAYDLLKATVDDPQARGVEWQFLAYYYVSVVNWPKRNTLSIRLRRWKPSPRGHFA